MNLYKTKYLAAISVGILVVISAVALTKSKKISPPSPPKNKQEKIQTVDTLPLIIYQVKGVEVVKATLEGKGTANPIAVLEIKNISDKSIIAVSVEIGEPEEAAVVTMEGFKPDDEPPLVIMEPNASVPLLLSLNNAKPGEPIRVSGVVYVDDSEEGEKTALETIHSLREHPKSGKADNSMNTPQIKIR